MAAAAATTTTMMQRSQTRYIPKSHPKISVNRFSPHDNLISYSMKCRNSFQDNHRIETSDADVKIRRLLEQFDPEIPIEEACTPASSWYTNPDFYDFEIDRVFYGGWKAVGYTEQVGESGDFFTGSLGVVQYVVCRDEKGLLHAFHNVCRHHASQLANASGKKSCFVCPYHGWTYGLNGELLKATRMKGVKNFKKNEMGLVPLKVASWGPFILINFEREMFPLEVETDSVGIEWLGSAAEILSCNVIDMSLDYICRRSYTIECNWKIFCDNYLDGGYHVPYAHKGLASGLQLNSYSTEIYEKVSIQSCEVSTGNNNERLAFDGGSEAFYAFVYPNLMINRYGPWMDTNLVIPLGPRKCQVIFDYFLDSSLKDDSDFIAKSLKDSEIVQLEDVMICESVQKGLESPAFKVGRYSPVEKAMHHFHSMLYANLSNPEYS